MEENKKNGALQGHHHRKLLLLLPLVLIPLLMLVFLILGGGKPLHSAEASQGIGGLLQLPASNLNRQDKMTKWEHYQKNAETEKQADVGWSDRLGAMEAIVADSTSPLSYERELYDKLAELDRDLQTVHDPDVNRPSTEDMHKVAIDEDQGYSIASKMLDSLAQENPQNAQQDPELDQLNRMLDKIIQIQQPASHADTEGLKLPSAVNSVATEGSQVPASFLENNRADSLNSLGFFSVINLDRQGRVNTIKVVIHEKQAITTGSTVKMRLLEDLTLPGLRIAKGSYLYGTAQINAERIQIRVDQLRTAAGIVPVKLIAHDMDGLMGIYIPDLIEQQVIVRSAEQSVQSLSLGESMSKTLALDAANAGLQAAKSLFAKKARRIQVVLQADYQLMLKYENDEAKF
ncbi:conjugative transposon protein TraM [Sphingobacterium sp. DK4209]|uniref:Conjugative transposon protein TraM n=1 Tax=Sphingobacterium zhuxiongii TaxID=2662364 RepID=A0A5Q0QCL8_9SPHI|nr:MULTISPECIES: conjugative transposon protein TraM [unclassified Sphingobacterium]MVZ65718.1 conjugative transposon protein TraM [Sphingobacterium sp. DK4209]QGA27917.1 conjugative transposon protein TraM [Sphingobacterium sp. dk4302]